MKTCPMWGCFHSGGKGYSQTRKRVPIWDVVLCLEEGVGLGGGGEQARHKDASPYGMRLRVWRVGDSEEQARHKNVSPYRTHFQPVVVGLCVWCVAVTWHCGRHVLAVVTVS